MVHVKSPVMDNINKRHGEEDRKTNERGCMKNLAKTLYSCILEEAKGLDHSPPHHSPKIPIYRGRPEL